MSSNRALGALALSCALCLSTPVRSEPPTERTGAATTALEDLPVPAKVPENPLRGRALLVGVNRYPDRAFNSLKGAERDVDDIASALQQRFGFAKADLTILEGPKASRQGILDGLEKLIAVSDAQTAAVFYFSGHGSQKKDTDGDEADGYDETLVPSDSSRDPGKNRDLTDDEIFDRMVGLQAKTKFVTVIFDSCHSGTAVRGGTARTATRDEAPGAAQSVRANKVDCIGDAADRNQEISYAFVGAAQCFENALESPREDGKVHGNLTWHLAKTLRGAGPGHTLRDLMDSVKASVSIESPGQHPQLEGRGQDYVAFGATELPPEPYVDLTNKDGKLTLAAGRVHGVTAQSKFAVYPPDTKSFGVTSQLLNVEVTSVGEFQSELRALEGKKLSIPYGRAVEREHRYEGKAIRVRFRNADPKLRTLDPIVADLRRALFAPPLNLAAEAEAWGRADLVVEMAPDSLRLLAADDTRIAADLSRTNTTKEAVVDRLKKQLIGRSRWLALLALNNPDTSGEPLDVVRNRVTTEQRRAGFDVSIEAGQELPLAVENHGDRTWYVTAVVVGGDGSIAPITPSKCELLVPGQTWRGKMRGCVNRDQSQSRDTVKLLFTTEPIDFGFLRQDPLITFRGQSAPRGGSPFEELVDSANGTRGLQALSVTTDNWVTRQQTVQVVAKDGVKPCGG
jgi:Caspase domain